MTKKSIALFLCLINVCFGQELFKSEDQPTFSNQNEPVEEKILTISESKRVFLITNNNGVMTPGDYVTIIFREDLTARAIVARLKGGSSALKIIKIYSLDNWKDLRSNFKISIIRGDDSYYKKPSEKKKNLDDKALVLTDDQLFDNETFSDDPDLKDKSKRHIKPDNLLGFSYGRISGIDQQFEDTTYSHFSARWAYQFIDNVWGELQAGQSIIKDFPKANATSSNGLTTILTSIIGRVKYTFSAPYYSYIMPYIGYQYRSASSDGAGAEFLSQAVIDEELSQLEQLEESKFILGVGLLKRIVPGWFISLNLGNDIINGGLTLEF